MVLARAPQGRLANFSTWQFRSRDGWTTNSDDPADLCNGMGSEYSVSWFSAMQSYVLICSGGGLSDKIIARSARDPWGPWNEASTVYRCPEMSWTNGIFCYAGKGHPMISDDTNELVITYAANAYQLSQVINDTRLYWPRFVRLTWR